MVIVIQVGHIVLLSLCITKDYLYISKHEKALEDFLVNNPVFPFWF